MSETPPSLTRRTIRGVAWTLPTSLGSRVVGLVGTLVLARFIAPADYGEVMAASIVTVTASSITTFGIGIYLVSNRDVSREEVFHATCLFLAIGAIALTVVTFLSGPLGRWSEAPDMWRYMPIFVVSAVLDRISFVPERVLVRNLRFRWLSLARAFSELVFTCVSLWLAALGHGAVSIAWGNLARSGVRFLALVPVVDWRDWLEPHRLRFVTMLKIIGYGVNVSVAQVATFAMRRWDNLLVSRYYGPGVMGAYNYAYNLADTPAVAIGEQMSDVIAASFPHAEKGKRAGALVRACTMISLIMFPLAFGLAAVADTVVQTFFDQKWASVGTMLVYLSVLSAPRPMAHILHAYFYACQRPRTVLLLEWASLAALMATLSTLGRVGIEWTCASVGVLFVLRTLAAMWMVKQIDGIPLRSFLLPLVRPLLGCVVMVAAVVAVRPLIHDLAPAVRLLIEVIVGAVTYAAGALLIFRSAAGELIELLRSALSRRPA